MGSTPQVSGFVQYCKFLIDVNLIDASQISRSQFVEQSCFLNTKIYLLCLRFSKALIRCIVGSI